MSVQINKITMRKGVRSTAQRMTGYAFILCLHFIFVVGLFMNPDRYDFLVLGIFYLISGMIGVNAGLHRYFSHRAFKTSRIFQFILGLLGCLTLTDPISFAGKHRLHHRYTDTQNDVHGPHFGFWQSWFGSLVDHGYSKTELRAQVKDLTKFPELMLLHRYSLYPAILTGALIWILGGFCMFAVGYIASVIVFMHLAGATNYFCHKYGYRRFESRDTSTNNIWVNLITMGEGWHNNHHAYKSSANLGFVWWEWDPAYYSIQLLSLLGLVQNVKTFPDRVKHNSKSIK